VTKKCLLLCPRSSFFFKTFLLSGAVTYLFNLTSFITMQNSAFPLSKLNTTQLLPTRLVGQAVWRRLLLCCGVFSLAASVQASPIAAGANKPSKSTSANEKVTICHNGHEINVSINASKAHLAHGDQLGSCSAGGDTGDTPIIWARNGKQLPAARR
jgi:hypothetical protein